ncbi:MAG: 50S ribosomal protein L22 [Actinomycetaceae bacterium]|nr:50S ribosomal protein L22 [Actinomycetaceae bacterium]
MEAKAQARYVRSTPMKARRVVNKIRGKRALEAYDMLRFAPQKVAEDVRKVLHSAMFNAKDLAQRDGETLKMEDLRIVSAYVDEGPTLKRFRPRAQGRAGRILKRTSHITVVVATPDTDKEDTL